MRADSSSLGSHHRGEWVDTEGACQDGCTEYLAGPDMAPLTVHEFDAAGNRIVVVDGRLSASELPVESVFRHVAGLDYVCQPDLFAVLTSRPGVCASFWNRDGSKERVCGNALRCIGWLLARQNQPETVWTDHGEFMVGCDDGWAWVDFPVASISARSVGANQWLVDCGTPHAVWMVEDLNDRDTAIRALQRSAGAGAINVTIAAGAPGGWKVRTFERGVGETGSCGTGAVAVFVTLARNGGLASSAGFEFASGHSLVASLERDAIRLRGTVNHVASKRTGSSL
jgi:diaminopimelate epimerase